MTAYMTDTQERIWRAIRELTDAAGYPPSIREIAVAAGLSSPSSVAYHLRTMEQHGIVTHAPGRARSYPRSFADRTWTVCPSSRIRCSRPLMADDPGGAAEFLDFLDRPARGRGGRVARGGPPVLRPGFGVLPDRGGDFQ
ncbi:hypothetical protein [Actinacidiphila oryziradicis]|uniref:LexA family protein n=1 Tax=Actinacidiphila oryziradicis TaxID=2571141 RepID=UPI003211E154